MKEHRCYVICDARNTGVWMEKFESDDPITQSRLVQYYEIERDFDWECDSISMITEDPEVEDLDEWEASLEQETE